MDVIMVPVDTMLGISFVQYADSQRKAHVLVLQHDSQTQGLND